MSTLPHLLPQPRSWRAQQRRRQRCMVLVVLLGVALASWAYLAG